MQAQKTSDGVSKRNREVEQSNLLLVGSENGFKSDITQRIFYGQQFRVAGRSTTLREGLLRLESDAIDLVLLSGEFREEELSLFVFDAHRRGFAGLILHVASFPGNRAWSEGRSGRRGGEGASQEKSEGNFRKPRRTQAQVLTAGTPAAFGVSGPLSAISFTAKERAVLTQVSEGLSNHQIACRLNCSEGSVKAVIQQLFSKLGVRKRTQIVRLALEKTTVQPQSTLLSTADKRPSHGVGRQPVANERPALPAIAESVRVENAPIQVGDFVIDVTSHRVWTRGVESQLSAQEHKLLTFFSRHPQELLKHHDLIEVLWDEQPSSRESLRVLIHALRRKIETTPRPRYIVTEVSFGYRFIPSP
jgi:DNA-binding response OmpR family regulator